MENFLSLSLSLGDLSWIKWEVYKNGNLIYKNAHTIFFLLAAVTDASHQVKWFDMKRKYAYIQILLLLDEKKEEKENVLWKKKREKHFSWHNLE